MIKGFNYVNEIQGKTARVNLYGLIGKDLNGHFLAQDILHLGENCDQINLYINSEGGSVLHGLSIVSAIISTPANVTAHIEGMALSMAGVIAVSCNQVKMADFSRFMAHDVSVSDQQKKDPKIANMLAQMKASLVTIFANNSKKSALDLDALMTRETWMTPQEALESGFIDEIYTTGKNTKKISTLQNLELVDFYNQLNSNKNTQKMESVINALGLPKEATEEKITETITALNTLSAEKDTKITDLEAAKSALETEKTNMTNQITALTERAATALVENAIQIGKVDPSKKEDMINMAKSDLSQFESFLGFATTKAPQIANVITGEPEGREKWTFDNWQKQDPAGLQIMMDTQKEKFTKLFNAYTGN